MNAGHRPPGALLAALFVPCLALLSCGDDASEPGPSRKAALRGPVADVGDDLVVAEVDGRPILGREVAALVAALGGGVGVEEAARALVDGELLAREAEARGFGRDETVTTARTRALARLLLEREVGGMAPEDLPEARLREFYEKNRGRFDRGPARVVVHYVARSSKKDPDAARELAALAAEAAAGAADERSFREALAPLVAEHGKRRLVVEKLPAFAADDTRFVAPFVEATFAIPAPGGFVGPVETRFGWHGILLLEELPPVRVPFEEARDTIARELIGEERQKAAARLIEGLERRVRPRIDESALAGEPHP
jgi:hypothetical protein